MNTQSHDLFIKEIAETVLESVGLDHIDTDELTADTQLSAPPLELDSIDVLEAVAAIEDKYKVHITDAKEGAKHFQSLGTIAKFITSHNL